MIAIDTNIIVRFLTQDDHTQYELSLRLFKQEDLFIPDSVLLETEWVLRFAYEFSPAEIVTALRKLLGLDNVYVEDGFKMAQVIDWHEHGLDFADALHLANSQHLPEFATFDEKFIKRADKKSKYLVRKP